MQDRFKFRFWDKETQTMQKIPMVELRHRITLDKIFADDRVIFMQCTGLKDKNGRLIYEGDIVKDDHEALHYVRWVYDSWQLFPCTQNNYTIGIVDDEIEVISNIYENKEILNEI